MCFRACLDREGVFLMGSDTVTLSRFKTSVDPDFLLGILNCKFVRCLQRLRFHAKPSGKTLSAADIRLLGIGNQNPAIQKAVGNAVRRIISAKRVNIFADTSGLEGEIDRQCGLLYGRSQKQIAALDD
jgi:hypothetical protein